MVCLPPLFFDVFGPPRTCSLKSISAKYAVTLPRNFAKSTYAELFFGVPCQFNRSRVVAGLPGYWTFIIHKYKNKNKTSWVAPGRACHRTFSDQNSTLTQA
ncbi:hypothetical protein AB1N83_002093 [Pleurotus pulmonarius]